MKHLRSACLLLLAAAPAWADDLKILPDKNVKGTLEKITDANVTLKVDGKSVDTPVPQVLDLTLRPTRGTTATRYIEVQLLDDSVLRCTKVTFTAKDAQLELTTGVSVKVPLSALVTVLRDADDPDVRKQWNAAMTDKVRKDRIFILKDGQLNPLQGVLGVIDEKEQKIRFKGVDVGELELGLEKLHGMQFIRTEVLPETGMCYVYDIEGNKLVAAKLAYDGNQMSVTTPFGQKIAFDPKNVSRIDFNLGRLTFLSDLEEKLTDPTLLGGFKSLQKNKNIDGDDIMLQDKKYDKGLSMYAGVELEYSLNEKYSSFKALLGVDTRVAEEGQGKVTVTIYCDGEKRNAYEVSVTAPVPIAVNVKDAKKLRIVVSGSNFTNFSGHAMLANAHVSQ